ncbi:MAG: TonB family protein [Candidatus Omnitrophica bacterium]|nr:TonB family protein [Candidatus Omnitrophota bacterium]
MKKNISKKYIGFFIFVATVFFLIAAAPEAFSKSFRETIGAFGEDTLEMVVGDLDTIWTKELTRVAVTDPSVADVVETSASEILMSGKKAGKTTVFIWDQYGKRSIVVWVFEENLDLVETRLKSLLQSAGIKDLEFKENALEGKIVVSGELDDAKKKEFDGMVEPFSDSIVNLVKEREKKELIEIDIQISEINTTVTKNLGIEWTNSEGGGSLEYDETLPTFNPNAPTDFFKIGDFARTTALKATINALITEGEGKVLSRPRIVMKSGEEASFLVGGQIPVSTTTTTEGGNVTQNIEFKDYGVDLNLKAIVKEDDKIDIELKVEVTDVDSSYIVSGNYAYTTRTAETKLLLDNLQTVVLAGFIKDNKAENISRVPFLSDIPILGAIFRNKSTDPNKQTELFITLTPKIISRNRMAESDDVEENIVKATPVIEEKPISTAKETFRSISVPANIANYVKAIQRKIAGNLMYPEDARQSNFQGAVDLELVLLRNGALLSALISQSSGYPVLDQAALNTAQRFSPYGNFPSDVNAREITVTIPIVYRLDMD